MSTSPAVVGLHSTGPEKFPDVPVSLRLAHGLVDAALSPRGRTWDLIVVGRHPMTSLTRTVTGSIATDVVERTHDRGSRPRAPVIHDRVNPLGRAAPGSW